MAGVCDDHKSKKKGTCNDCYVCRFCEPAITCTIKDTHYNWKRKAKRLGIYQQTPDTKTPKAKGVASRRGKRSSEMRGKKRKIVDSSMFDYEFDDEYEIISNLSHPRCNKDTLLHVFELLGVDKGSLICPNNGYAEETFNSQETARRRSKRIVSVLTGAICDLVSPQNVTFKDQVLGKKVPVVENDYKRLFENATKLVFFGNKQVRGIIRSLMAKSVRNCVLKELLAKESEKYTENEIISESVKKKAVFGKYHYSSMRKAFDILMEGKDIPKHDYSYRIDSNKLSTAVTFIQESLCIKPGVVRDVNIAGHLFKDMPVYERGGKSIESLNTAYNNVFSTEERIGMNTFTEIVKLLTKRGESKAGLSTYYIQLRYCGSVFKNMMKRVQEFKYASADIQKHMKDRTMDLAREWDDIQMFVMWEYSNTHLELTYTDSGVSPVPSVSIMESGVAAVSSVSAITGTASGDCVPSSHLEQDYFVRCELCDTNIFEGQLHSCNAANQKEFVVCSAGSFCCTWTLVPVDECANCIVCMKPFHDSILCGVNKSCLRCHYESCGSNISSPPISTGTTSSTSTIDRIHCCSHALGGDCITNSHEHLMETCSKCSNCFTFFDTKVHSFLKEVKEQLFEEREEVDSMLFATPKLTHAIKFYMAHRLRAKVQFAAIDKVKHQLKDNPSKGLFVMDHKQKILQMKYREGQVEYYGKKGMSLLGVMLVQWVTKTVNDEEVSGFQYKFIDYIFKGYAGQDNVQVASAIQIMVKQTKEQYPGVNEIIFQSDNASCFASQELIPFIYHLNSKSTQENSPIISKWIYTEAQTGRGRLDTHFSYLNLILKSFVEDGNDIQLEEHILQALSFRGGVAGTTGVLINCDNLIGPAITKKFKSTRIGSRATHEICWQEGYVEIYESSNITQAEKILDAKLQKHKKNELGGVVQDTFVSEKNPLFVKEKSIEGYSDESATLSGMTSKAQCIQSVLLHNGIVRHRSIPEINTNTIIAPQAALFKWAIYPGNNPNKLTKECLVKLKELYDIGKNNKKRKVGAERAHQILIDTLLFDKWDKQIDLTVPKIKAFFQMNPRKMQDSLNALEIASDDVDEASRRLVERERDASALSLMDSETTE